MGSTFTQPNRATQAATTYTSAIDSAIAVMSRMSAIFAGHAQSTPDMTVRVDAGVLFANGALNSIAAQSTDTITAPASNNRIDRIVVDEFTGVAEIITGTVAASPSAPDIPVGKLPVCRVALASTTTSITNALITDERTTFLSKRTLRTIASRSKLITDNYVIVKGDDGYILIMDTPTGGSEFTLRDAQELFDGFNITLLNLTDNPLTVYDGVSGNVVKNIGAMQVMTFAVVDTNLSGMGLVWITLSDYTDHKSKVSADDTTPGHLADKIVAGTNITLNVLSGGADETLEIVASGGIDSVSQGDLNVSTQEVSGAVSTTTVSRFSAVSSGGAYILGTKTKHIGGVPAYMIASGHAFPTTTSYVARIGFEAGVAGSGSTGYAQFTYITATRPYDLGDGMVASFVFMIVNPDKSIHQASASVDPPWAHNGPTDIRPMMVERGRKYRFVPKTTSNWEAIKNNPAQREAHLDALVAYERDPVANGNKIEITQQIKQADMPLIPHPYIGRSLLPGQTLVLLDPVSDVMHRALELELSGGPTLLESLHNGDLVFGNAPLSRSTPPGVNAYNVSWR